jgi:hypothetical protein
MSEDENPPRSARATASASAATAPASPPAPAQRRRRAATLGLLLSEVPETVVSRLPNGHEQAFAVIDGSVEESAGLAHAAIVKDAGDDPDATHGAHLTADVRLLPHRAGEVVLKGGRRRRGDQGRPRPGSRRPGHQPGAAPQHHRQRPWPANCSTTTGWK